MRSAGRTTVLCLLSLAVAGCIAPLPVESVADPWVRGTIVSNGIATANVEVWLDHQDNDACEDPGMRTRTDADGRFSFEGKMRTWTWLGWANNHFVHGCIITPEGARPFGIITANDPQQIEVECDTAKDPRQMCRFSCADGWNGRC